MICYLNSNLIFLEWIYRMSDVFVAQVENKSMSVLKCQGRGV